MIEKINQLSLLSGSLITIGILFGIIAIWIFVKNQLLQYLKMRKRGAITKRELEAERKRQENELLRKYAEKKIKKETKKEEKMMTVEEIKEEVAKEERLAAKIEALKQEVKRGEAETTTLEDDGDKETSFLEKEPQTQILSQEGEEDTDILDRKQKREIEDKTNEDDKIWGRSKTFIAHKEQDVMEIHGSRNIED